MPSDNRKSTFFISEKRPVCFALANIILLLSITLANAFDCVTDTYADQSLTQKTTVFDIGKKVYLGISCTDLPPGDYYVHVNWIRDNSGVIRNESDSFSLSTESDRVFYFWMKLDTKRFVKRLFSSSDYDENLLGLWYVECYINNTLISKNPFTFN
jgi:hypothetical protein